MYRVPTVGLILALLMIVPNSSAGDGRETRPPEVKPPPESVFGRFRENDREPARQFYSKFLEVQGMRFWPRPTSPMRRWYGRATSSAICSPAGPTSSRRW